MTKSRGIRAGRGGPVITYPLFVVEFAGYKTACWLWQRKTSNGGYGIWHRKEHSTCMAHKQIWQMTNGSVPEGLELDHLCRNRHCVRPDHLEPVDRRTNVRRGLVCKFSEAQIESCCADAVRIGVKPAARQLGINHSWLRDQMNLRGLKSPLKTGRQPKEVTQ